MRFYAINAIVKTYLNKGSTKRKQRKRHAFFRRALRPRKGKLARGHLLLLRSVGRPKRRRANACAKRCAAAGREKGFGVPQPTQSYAAPAADLEQTLARYADTVLRAAYAMVKNRDDAQDIAQEVFLSLLRANPSFESAEHEKAWLLRATINRCKSFFKSAWQQKTQGLSEDFPAAHFTPGESTAVDAVNRLTAKYRRVVYLYYIEGYDTAEVAKILGLPQNTVLSQLARARKQLRELLKGDFDDV